MLIEREYGIVMNISILIMNISILITNQGSAAAPSGDEHAGGVLITLLLIGHLYLVIMCYNLLHPSISEWSGSYTLINVNMTLNLNNITFSIVIYNVSMHHMR